MSEIVSVVIPCHNAAAFLRDTLESVLQQTYKSWELIIVDDASTDASSNVADEYSRRESRVRLVKLDQNTGVSHARNVATKLARGRYIAFLDSDDMWLPEKLERQVLLMQSTGAALCYTSYRKMSENGKIGAVVNVPVHLDYNSLLKTNRIACLSVMYNADSVGKFYFDESLSTNEDYVLWLSMLKRGVCARGLNVPLALYRVRANSRSSNKFRTARDQWIIYRKIERLSFWKSIFYFAHYAFHGLRKSVL